MRAVAAVLLAVAALAKEAEPPDELLDNLDFFMSYEVAQNLDGLESEETGTEEAEVEVSTDTVQISSGTQGKKP